MIVHVSIKKKKKKVVDLQKKWGKLLLNLNKKLKISLRKSQEHTYKICKQYTIVFVYWPLLLWAYPCRRENQILKGRSMFWFGIRGEKGRVQVGLK